VLVPKRRADIAAVIGAALAAKAAGLGHRRIAAGRGGRRRRRAIFGSLRR
jgi:hypothetical protein